MRRYNRKQISPGFVNFIPEEHARHSSMFIFSGGWYSYDAGGVVELGVDVASMIKRISEYRSCTSDE